ncbi:MAG: hypothetical protein A2651_00215 [Candidatus Yanofskybacteria bacterium RIFCSPHIGHO2_01_FULL_42_12]|uniref:Uncharacterized protein n=1 Tax=Candidatus Yanofskybacteria bacterium RIFCSPLOWO2_01_FULL_42_49 TaxID=1802694 RepID=A0A1F8GE93_9BACT|nr:MAG: hypothetical protein A2651_00215 [Candidatus Yanofskybacteria bacterium RIFCSPHIGHO2_01_FULL_42_12]OGN23048.1 MAG: hypothetical protein A2918_02875 [Candidatus Yanofskybacteria bacterium RIFCSPLOWO2_01_FULL_42_49]
MSVIFDVTKPGVVKIRLKKGNKVVADTHLTVGQGFDILLIRTLDKALHKNKIGGLSLKSVEIEGEIEAGSLAGMLLISVAKALII